MATFSDDEIDYLLSSGGMSGEGLERIRARLVRAAHGRARTRRLWLALTTAGAVAAVSTALLVLPRNAPNHETLRVKGAGGAFALPVATLHVTCVGASLSACPRGAVLGFAVKGSPQAGFVTAFADPVGGVGDRIWYFSDQPLASTEAAATPARTEVGDTRVLANGVRIGPDHIARRYQIQMVFSRGALGRDEAALDRQGPDVIAHATFDLEVLP